MNNTKTPKKKNTTAKAKSVAKRPKYNNIICPKGMTLEEWQRALRAQQAESETFGIEALEDGTYSVKNSATRSAYKVVFRGEGSPWNFCSCMDFKTSRLGTCKHIEAVRLKGGRVSYRIPSYTSVYLDYPAGRVVKIRIGTDNESGFRSLAVDYFGHDGCLKEEAYASFGEFLQKAKQINPSFRCYQDALDFVLEHRAKSCREQFAAEKCTDEALDGLLSAHLYPYQKEGIRFSVKAGKAIIADEMGLGKTIQAIGVAELLRREGLVTSVLIVVPTSLKYQWKREIERFVGNGIEALVVEGSHAKRSDMYRWAAPYKIVSYNAVCNDIKILGKLRCDLLIMDEVQRLKNWNTQIARAARRIESEYSVILSGTPLENKLEELYSIVELVDQYALAPYYKFHDDCILTDETGKVVAYRNLNVVGEKLKDVLIRRRKRDVNLQLPERVDKNLFVPMTKEQREMHDELKSDVGILVAKWKHNHFLSEKDRKRLLLDLSQMRMLCDSTYILDQRTRCDTKIEEVMSILDDILSGGADEKVVIFSQWERMTRLVAAELKARHIRFEYLHGGVPSEKRKNMVANFTDDPDVRVFLSTDAGSTGLNLQSAATVINLDLPWNPAVLEQRIARIYRIGQHRNIQVINLIAADTIEENMIAKLRFKTSMFEGVLDGGEDTIFVSEDKFKSLVSVVGDYVESESECENSHEPKGGNADAEGTVVAEDDREPKKEDAGMADLFDEQSDVREEKTDSRTAAVADAGALIEKGVSFISDFVETLKSPEATNALVDSLVVHDEKTNQTSVRIPVKDKDTVRSLFQLIGQFLGSK